MKFATWITAQSLVFIAIDLATHATSQEITVDVVFFAIWSAILIAKIPAKK